MQMGKEFIVGEVTIYLNSMVYLPGRPNIYDIMGTIASAPYFR